MSRHALVAGAWALLIAFLCLTPGSTLPTWEWADLLSVDKAVHALMFGVLTVLLARAMRKGAWTQGKVLFVACMVSVVYGGAMELLQSIPGLGRQGDWVDLTANTAGALFGLFWLRRRWNRERHTIQDQVV